jgi:HD-like signal output (HDOD) protein
MNALSGLSEKNLTAQSLVLNCKGLAALPSIYQELDLAIKSPNSSNFKIVQIINSDPALASKLLQITNSAHYNFSAKIETISHAVAIVGTNELRDLALATSVVSLTNNLANKNIDFTDFWYHNISCAIAARIIATFRRETNLEQFYLAGLLHDIGRLILMIEIPDDYEAMQKEAIDTQTPMRKVEQAHLGFDHCDVGYELTKHWELPDYLQAAVCYHHQPGNTKEHQTTD